MRISFHLYAKQKRNLLRIFLFVVIGLVFGLVYAFIEKGLMGNLRIYPATGNPYHPMVNSALTVLQGGVAGLILGVIEVLLLGNLFSKKAFLFRFILKSVIYFLIVLFIISLGTMISSSINLGLSILDTQVFQNLITYLSNESFWSLMVYIGVVFSLALLLAEISDHLGPGVLRNFVVGKYHRAREESRIFMFMDMKASTTLAEQLGHAKYFRFLNEYYNDVTEAIIRSYGEIYQYVGDEVVVSWSLADGLRNHNCLRCFYLSKSIIKSHKDKYKKEYGAIPKFKAALHCGNVATGRIGLIKKEIVFTGDVLNTTARIQQLCNSYSVDNLMSEELLKQLKSNTNYSASEVGVVQLRGKDEQIKVYTFSRNI